jgi:acyl-CoA thioesterase-1
MLSIASSIVLRSSLVLLLLYAAAAPPVLAQARTILFLGDSISAGYGMSLEQGWVALLARQLDHSHPGFEVVNASISGETSVGALARLPALLTEHEPAVVVIELGGNDGLRGYPVKRFRENLSSMTALSQDAGAGVILVQMEIPPNYGSRYTQAFSESYALVAAETGALLAPFLLDGVATAPGLMQADGIHPTVEAQPRLLENFLPTLLALLEEL